MRKIINSTYATLDGVIQDPQDWPELGSFSDTGYAIQTELLLGCDAVLMGRHTYDGFVPVWTKRSGDPYSDHINAITKYVVSTTLTDPEWANTTVIDNDLLYRPGSTGMFEFADSTTLDSGIVILAYRAKVA
jgi:dihydrofolate reductase